MGVKHDKPHPGEQVILVALPPDLLDGLPAEDYRAISAMVGKKVMLVCYDEVGSAELHFDDPFHPRTDESSLSHSIWVGPEFIRRISPTDAE